MSRLGLGCMSMSGTYGGADASQAIRALDAALEAEVTFWDTADVYGNGKNEELIGKALAGRREQVVLAGKCGITGRGNEGLILNGRPDYIKRACEASLKRLQTDYLDLYYLHRVDPDVPVEESVGAIGELVSRGLVRFAGLSEAGPESLRRAHREFPLSALQSEYSLFSRGVESEILPLARELGISLVAYAPLGRGLLTGAVDSVEQLEEGDFRRQLPRFEQQNLDRNRALVQRVEAVARARGCTTAQVALAWLLAQEPAVIPIPGTKRPRYVHENAEAVNIALSPQELASLDFSRDEVAGERYPSSLARAVGR